MSSEHDRNSGAKMTPPDQTARALATDTRRSCIVQAPAGSGKTTLLALRYVTLLAQVEQPQQIVAITFTKKAAAEMRSRVLAMLREDTPLAAQVRERATRLGWQLEHNPNVLKIQTIDGFAMEISRQTPATEGVSGLQIVEDARPWFDEAAGSLLRQMFDNAPQGDVVADFLTLLDNDANAARALIADMLAHRDQWLQTVVAAAQDSHADPAALQQMLSQTVSRMRTHTLARLEPLLDADDLARLREVCGDSPDSPWSERLAVLITKQNTLRKKFNRKDGYSDAAQLREMNLWLTSLHARGLDKSFELLARMPLPADIDTAAMASLRLCCVTLALAADELQQLFARDRVTDFTGLLMSATSALADSDGNPTDLALHLDYRIRHVLVDEYQDTSRSQLAFFRRLLAGWDEASGTTFFAVGDPMQSIYRFRDADVSIFAETRDQGIANRMLERCHLTANFRSAPTLVEWCNALFANLFGALETAPSGGVAFHASAAMRPGANAQVPRPHAEDPVTCRQHPDADAETRAVADQIAHLVEAAPTQSIAILCRARGHLKSLLEALRVRGVPWQATDIDLLRTRPVVLEILALHGVLTEPANRQPWFEVLRAPMFGMTLEWLATLADIEDIAAHLDDMPASPGDHRVARLMQAWHWARRRLYERPLREVLEGFWIRCGGSASCDSSALDIASQAFDLLDDAARDLSSAELGASLDSLYATDTSTATVQVMTIHKAKGLEFDHVFVPYIQRQTASDNAKLFAFDTVGEGTLLGVRGDAVHAWLDYEERQRATHEERRLLYVACTRARETLHLSFNQTTDRRPGGLARLVANLATSTPVAAHTDTLPSPSPRPSAAPQMQQDLFSAPTTARLPIDWRWQAPEYAALPAGPAREPADDEIADRVEVALGNVVHLALAWIARQQVGEFREPDPTKLSACVAHFAALQPLASGDREQVLQLATDQVQQALESRDGRWVLTPHTDHEAELPLTGFVNGEIRHVVLDRTFVDTDGTRWIIDYKSTRFDAASDTASKVALAVQRYEPQLRAYANIAGALYAEPVRTALFLTDIATLHVSSQPGS